MTSHLAALIYSWGRRLSATSDSFYPSVRNIAAYFECDRTTVMRALTEMIEKGWAEVIHKEPGKPVVYRFPDHDEWARNHPGLCVSKDSMPWEGEGDPLAKQLHAVSGGLAKFLPGQMDGLRKSGMSDEQIASEFRVFLDRNPQKGKNWSGIYYKFHPHLLRLAADLRKAGDTKNSRREVLHRSDIRMSHACDTSCGTVTTHTCCTGATQVFEVNPESVGEGKSTIPALLSQGRSSDLPPQTQAPGRGFPPSKPSPSISGKGERRTQ